MKTFEVSTRDGMYKVRAFGYGMREAVLNALHDIRRMSGTSYHVSELVASAYFSM